MATANPSTPTDDRPRPSPTHRSDPESGRSLALPAIEVHDHPLTRALQAAAFWAAVVLPFVSLAVLLGPGVHTGTEAAALGGLLVCNVAAVLGGHGYHA